MTQYCLSKDIKERLNRQLEDIRKNVENQKRDSEDPDVINEIDELNETYAKQLRQILEQSVHTDADDLSAPFVVIGSTAEVCDLDSGEVETYHIVISHEFSLESDDVTFSSPIGKALLFKKVGDHVEIKIPVGKIRYIVNRITLDPDISLNFHPRADAAPKEDRDKLYYFTKK